MAGGGVVLRWLVENGGYRWVETADGYDPIDDLFDTHVAQVDRDGPWLIPALDHTSSGGRTLRVHEERGDRQPAHRAFAVLAQYLDSPKDVFQKAIVEFAGNYGSLGPGIELGERAGEGTWSDGPRGESLGRWWREIERFSDLFLLAELFRKHDRQSVVQLGQRLRWDDDRGGVRYYGPRGRWTLIATKDFNPRQFRRLDPSRPFETAWFHLSRCFTKELQGSLSLVVPSVPDTAASYAPQTLRHAIWVQLYYATIGQEPGRQCRWCGGWFSMEIPLGDGTKRKKRSDTRTCSNACKTALSRARGSSVGNDSWSP